MAAEAVAMQPRAAAAVVVAAVWRLRPAVELAQLGLAVAGLQALQPGSVAPARSQVASSGSVGAGFVPPHR
jgi:hypothetical protein